MSITSKTNVYNWRLVGLQITTKNASTAELYRTRWCTYICVYIYAILQNDEVPSHLLGLGPLFKRRRVLVSGKKSVNRSTSNHNRIGSTRSLLNRGRCLPRFMNKKSKFSSPLDLSLRDVHTHAHYMYLLHVTCKYTYSVKDFRFSVLPRI